jgi:hypothetical protein
VPPLVPPPLGGGTEPSGGVNCAPPAGWLEGGGPKPLIRCADAAPRAASASAVVIVPNCIQRFKVHITPFPHDGGRQWTQPQRWWLLRSGFSRHGVPCGYLLLDGTVRMNDRGLGAETVAIRSRPEEALLS